MKKIEEPNITVRDGVFWPSHGAQIILECMKENPDIFNGKSILDIGCGTWILAIFAAKIWASRVCASDIDSRAIENTKANAIENEVDIDARIWNYGVPFWKEKFDVVIANLPQEKSTWFVNMRWNESILAFLPDAERYIKPGGKLILAINGCTPYKETIEEIQKNWTISKAKWRRVEVKKWVQENIQFFLTGDAVVWDKKDWYETPIFYLVLERKTS